MVQKGTWRTTIWDELRRYIDSLFFRSLSLVEHKIIKGEYFTAHHSFMDVSSGSTVDILISTGSIPMSVVANIVADGSVSISFYEDSVVSAEGNGVDVVNHNRLEDRVKDCETGIFSSPTVDDNGYVMFENEYLPGGQRRNQFFGAVSGKREPFILKANTNYVITVKNETNSENTIDCVLAFYEDGKLI